MHLLLLFALSVFAASDDHMPSACHGDAIVKSVSWENEGELSSVQQAKLGSVLAPIGFERTSFSCGRHDRLRSERFAARFQASAIN
jgi:hypothetical protein